MEKVPGVSESLKKEIEEIEAKIKEKMEESLISNNSNIGLMSEIYELSAKKRFTEKILTEWEARQ